MGDVFVKYILLPSVGIVAMAAIALAALAIYGEVVSEKFSLRKDEWTCTETNREVRNVPIGKAVVPRAVDVCINWRRL